MTKTEVLCVGEVLWDALPEGLFLGGAPFNVACHLRATGTPVAMVSRIGSDRLGDEVLRRAARYGVTTDLLQVDSELATGFVRVDIDPSGNPSYEICAPAAWDAIEANDALLRRAASARAIVFGTLAQRNAESRDTIRRLWESDALIVFDVNLRAPFEDQAVVAESLHRADVVKLSAEELESVAEWFSLGSDFEGSIRALAMKFESDVVCVTRGSKGAALLHGDAFTEHPGYEVEVKDTVGAGDAFLAVLLAGLLGGATDAALLQHANLIGAYVTTQYGAVPADQGSAMSLPVATAAPPNPKAKKQTSKRSRR
ncbi:MAG: carbohydrate kinase [Gemmatimonadota bacterium]|nr:carbohydrate kinase [Gemmatimonadota bacterium]